jgi:RNA 2',3'-cyclic 3'-phosphodiesterase
MSRRRLRLFVALDLPGAVRGALAAWAAAEVGQAPGVRLVAEGSLHVTLCFLGAVDAASAEAIAEACTVAAQWSPLALSLLEPLWLPRRRPRVLAVSLGDEAGELGAMQAALAATLADGGWYEPERRPFLAHVTVARTGQGSPAWPRDAAAPETLMVPPRFVAQSVSLYRSHTGAAGARYESLATVALSGG